VCYCRILQETKAIWCRRLREEMRVWRNGEVLIKGKNRIIRLKTEKEHCLKSHFIFSYIHRKMKSKHQSSYPRLCVLTRNPFFHLYGHSEICTSTDHRLVCWISGACLMAISKGTFAVTLKWRVNFK
jgi:hypothetical protein